MKTDWPQITMLVVLVLGLIGMGINAKESKTPGRSLTYNLAITAFSQGLIYAGGFWS